MKRAGILFFIMLIFSFCCEGYGKINELEKILVYGMNSEGSKFYRIPALITAADGTLIAIADKRGDEIGDLPDRKSVV